MPLSTRDCWIFDMDGTLTVAAHDFDAIRAELGLPEGKPILEEIARLSSVEAAAIHRKLAEIEIVIAKQARPQPGASKVLDCLRGRGVRLGILTRNSESIAEMTLAASGLGEFFSSADIVGRESSVPKPLPDGVFELLGRWGGTAERAVMIGDSHFDLEAGRRAGTATVYFDVEGKAAGAVEGKVDGDWEWAALADYRIAQLPSLLDLVSRS